MEEDDIATVDTSLMKGVAVTPIISDKESISVLTGETRDRKAKSYAAVESQKITKQYGCKISNLNEKLEDNAQIVLDLQNQ